MKLRNTTNCDKCCKGKRISELDEKVDIQGTEYIPYQEGDDNGKFSLGSLKDYLIKLVEEYLINNGIIREDWVQSEPAYKLLATLPELIADRACKDEFGNNINDTYLTRESVKEYIGSIFEDLFTENPPKILDGYITVDMLSDAVLQLLNSGGAITNFPDDEDLTVKDGKLKFKDKAYDPNNYSGFGRKYLRRNMVDGVNVLTQEMISNPNTKYIIQYDYDLNEEEITIPEGCVLQFEGGSLSNGTIICNNTIFVGTNSSLNINIEGTFINQNYIIPKGIDVSDILQKIIDLNNALYLERGTYLLSKPLRVKSSSSIIGEGSGYTGTILRAASEIDNIITTEAENEESHATRNFVTIRNITIDGNKKAKYGVRLVRDANCYLSELFIENCGIGLMAVGWSHTIRSCSFAYNIIGASFANESNQLDISGCYFNSNKVGFYVNGGRAIKISASDIELNTVVGCVIHYCTGVEISTCYFESNGSIGASYSASDINEDYWNYSGISSASFNGTLRADIILTSYLSLLDDNNHVRLTLANGYLCQYINISNNFFNSPIVSYPIIGSIFFLESSGNTVHKNNKAIFGIINSYNIIVKSLVITNNIRTREEGGDGKVILFVPPIGILRDETNTWEEFYVLRSLKDGEYKLDTRKKSIDVGRNLYAFNESITESDVNLFTTNLKIEKYNHREVIYSVSLEESSIGKYGFYSFSEETEQSSRYFSTDDLYRYELYVKTNRELEEGESVKISVVGINDSTSFNIDRTINGINSTDYVLSGIFFNKFDDRYTRFRFVISCTINSPIIIYIKNPRLFNISMNEDSTPYYFEYLVNAQVFTNNYYRPNTCGVKVGEIMKYSGDNSFVNKRNLICSNTGIFPNKDTWINLKYHTEDNTLDIKDINEDGTLTQKVTII